LARKKKGRLRRKGGKGGWIVAMGGKRDTPPTAKNATWNSKKKARQFERIADRF